MNQDSIDLDINNYDLYDLLKLFKLDSDYNESDLKNIKRLVLMTHPDKSGLDKDYFLFYSNAYKILVNIYKIRTSKTTSTAYIVNEDNNKKYIYEKFNEQVDELTRKNRNKSKEQIFNKLFNEMFENNYIKDEENDAGYGEWFSSEQDLDNRIATKQNMNQMFEMKKQEIRHNNNENSIVNFSNKYTSITQTNNKKGLEAYSLHNNLQYEDLKTAYTETVVPVTHEDYLNKKKYGSVDHFMKSKEYNDVKPLSLEQSKQYLYQQSKANNDEEVYRAYKLQKQDELAQKMNQNLMAQFKYLK